MSIQLIDCPACGSRVSSQAAACPHCGQPIRPVLKVPPIAAAAMTRREAWTPWSKKSKTVSSSVSFSNVRITSDAILQRVRSAFSHHGFSVKQGEVREGTATTRGGFSDGESGGLVGGLTAIDKKTWNPFLVSRAENSFIEAEITVLNVRQRMQTQDAVSSLMVQDIELQMKIQMTEWNIWLITLVCSFLGLFIGIFVGLASTDGGQGAALVAGIIGAFLAYCIAENFLHSCFWTAPNVKRLSEAIDSVIENLVNNLK